MLRKFTTIVVDTPNGVRISKITVGIGCATGRTRMELRARHHIDGASEVWEYATPKRPDEQYALACEVAEMVYGDRPSVGGKPEIGALRTAIADAIDEAYTNAYTPE